MPLSRVDIDLAFESDADGRVKPEARAAHDSLLDAIAAARPFAVWASEGEDSASAVRHVCHHDEGRACDMAEEIGVRPPRRVAVKVAVVEGGEVIR